MNWNGKEIFKIAAPAVLESLVLVLVATVDTRMISELGNAAISAVGATAQPKLVIFSIFYALGTAVSFFVAQTWGSGDRKKGNAYFHVIVRLTVILSVVLGLLLALLSGPVVRLFSRHPDTVEMSGEFFRIIMACMVFQTLSIVLNGALRGTGQTGVTFYASLVLALTDILFNYLLIEGHLGFPRLGVAGDAIATVMGTVAACGVSLCYLMKKSDFLTLKGVLRPEREDGEILPDIRKKAGNIVLENVFVRIGFLLTSVIITSFPPDKTSVYFVALLLLQYSFAFGDGLQAATITMTGNSVGAGNREEFRHVFRVMIRAGLVLSAMLSLVYVLGARWFFGQYFEETALIEEGFVASVFAAGITFFQILRIVCIAGLRGMGEVRDPRRIATLCVFLLNPGLSYLLAYPLKLEITGIWLSSLLTQIVWMILAALSFRKNAARLQLTAP